MESKIRPEVASTAFTVDDGRLVGGIETLKNREAYEVHSWYPYLEELTVRTTFMPFSLEEALAWRKVYIGQEEKMSSTEIKAYTRLTTRLKHTFDTFKQTHPLVNQTNSQAEGGYFVRLSTRSPKDAPENLPRARAVTELKVQFDKLIKSHPECEVGERKDLQLLALRRTWFNLMRVENAEQALELCSLSNRVIRILIL